MVYKREERIQQIKDCGQSIIDNAESIYGNYDFPQGLKIIVSLEMNEVPKITTVKSFIPENYIGRLE